MSSVTGFCLPLRPSLQALLEVQAHQCPPPGLNFPKSPCQTQKNDRRKPANTAKAFLTYNDMKLFRIKHVNACDVFQTSGICCTCICLSSLSSTSILCTRLPGRIPLVPRMRLVQRQHFYASNFQRKFFKRFRAQIPIQPL